MTSPARSAQTVAVEHLRALIQVDPFPWQRRLLKQLIDGCLPSAIDIPTGLGKTMTMAIWLVARACGASVPRRLVYVVDRRAVVDQATAEAERLANTLAPGTARQSDAVRALRLGLGLSEGQTLPVSTLRGQFVDNRRWLEDPTVPAIVVGTIDMTGSRLLFEGYGVSRRMRPVHAGLLGVDALIVLDEAHLVPPFEGLLAEIARPDGCRQPRDQAIDVPAFHLLPLSATGHHQGSAVLTLDGEDESDARVGARLHGARKPLKIEELDDDADLVDLLSDRAWALRTNEGSPRRVLVFCDQRELAQKVAEELARRLRTGMLGEQRVRLLVGSRRVKERQDLLLDPIYRWFLRDEAESIRQPAFLVATSAGEVGVDLDADAMVCDLVAWERMVQRMGRVNRRPVGSGVRSAPIIVLAAMPPEAKKLVTRLEKENDADKRAQIQSRLDTLTESHRARLALLRQLEPVESDLHNASTGELARLKERAFNDAQLRAIVGRASTLNPLRPPLERPLVDAWSMTSLHEHPGRPRIQPWLRGWIDEDAPQTELIWRRHLPWRAGAASPDRREVEDYFDAARVHLSEVLETEAWRAIGNLHKRAKAVLAHQREFARAPDCGVIVLDQRGGFVAAWPLRMLATDDKKRREEMEEVAVGSRLVIQADLAGLDRHGLLDPGYELPPSTVDDASSAPGNGWTESDRQMIGFRVVAGEATAPAEAGWRRVHFWPFENDDDAQAQGLRVDAWRAADSGDESPEIARVKQSLAEHHQWAGEAARHIGERLSLPQTFVDMLVAAARAHDAGKARAIWQDSVGASRGERPLAKSDARGDPNRLKVNGVAYRHEFGSLFDAQRDPDIAALPADLRDLALHLIAAHHGFARPVIAPLDPDHAPSASEALAREAALRFARLQKRWGPWGLAWWEAVFRAADWVASRRLNQQPGEE